ncbi:hypothetical protein MKW92_032502 [Papaver armeniacum]|nr:hypothetical protein MKW92_032502 [Papaver armeniacum]
MVEIEVDKPQTVISMLMLLSKATAVKRKRKKKKRRGLLKAMARQPVRAHLPVVGVVQEIL